MITKQKIKSSIDEYVIIKDIVLNEDETATIVCYIEGQVISSDIFIYITKQEYIDGISSDDYFINYVINDLGFIKA